EEAEMFGGTVGEKHDTNYHQPTDTIDNVSQESLDIFAPAIGFAVHTLAYELVDEPTDPPTEPTTPPTDPTDPPTATPTETPADPTDHSSHGPHRSAHGDADRNS